jgi:hypothetical protein
MEPRKQMKAQNKVPEITTPPPPPPPNPIDVRIAVESARTKLTEAFKSFHSALFNKKLDANKSKAEKDQETQITQELFTSAAQLDQINVGEGTAALNSLAIRELFKMRDRLNEVEYRGAKTINELNELKEALGESK